jgi:hypothetical protein
MKTRNYYGKTYLVLERKKGEMTRKCPFCNTGHIHGSGDGHRVAHCKTGSKESVFVDQMEVFKSDGYFIETI